MGRRWLWRRDDRCWWRWLVGISYDNGDALEEGQKKPDFTGGHGKKNSFLVVFGSQPIPTQNTWKFQEIDPQGCYLRCIPAWQNIRHHNYNPDIYFMATTHFSRATKQTFWHNVMFCFFHLFCCGSIMLNPSQFFMTHLDIQSESPRYRFLTTKFVGTTWRKKVSTSWFLRILCLRMKMAGNNNNNNNKTTKTMVESWFVFTQKIMQGRFLLRWSCSDTHPRNVRW